MANGNVSVGQWADFQAKVGQRLWPALKSRVLSGALDIKFLADNPDLIQSALVRGFSSIQEEIINPTEFFVTRQGLHVWNEFTERILSVCRPTKLVSDVKLKHIDLPRDMTDAEIRSELGDDHVFTDPSIFCFILAKMLLRQWNGKGGQLLTNGCANIFYVIGKNGEVFAVRVRWFSDGREWDVSARRLGDDRWDAGRRAFSAKALKKAA